MATLPLPDRDRLSALGALMLLAIGLVQVVSLPALPIELAAVGLLLRVEINSTFVLIGLAAGVTVSGADWLARTHPRPPRGWDRLEPVVIPGLATLAAGSILARLEPGWGLWVGLASAAGALMATVVAEFIVLDRADPRREAASIGLTALGQTLLTGVYFALLSLRVRAFFLVPLAFLATAAVAWRLLRLHLPQPPAAVFSVAIGAILAQLTWALYYLPLSSAGATLALGLISHIGTYAVLSHLSDRLTTRLALEFGLVGAVGLALAIGLS